MLDYPRTSPIQPELEKLNPVWGDLHRMRTPLRYRPLEEEREHLQDLALCDLSALPKLGLKGRGCAEWLHAHYFTLPDRVYEWKTLPGEGLLMRTDRDEFFLEDGFKGESVCALGDALGSGGEKLYRVERQDAGLLLSGRRALEVLRQTCSYEFSESDDRLVMTRVALVSCAILPVAMAGVPGFRLWFIPGFGIYLWQNLLQIVEESGGKAVGIECLTG